MVWVDGALWEATVEGGWVLAGQRVEVVTVEGLHMRVRPVHDVVSVPSDATPGRSDPAVVGRAR
jgi:hypothetical protein